VVKIKKLMTNEFSMGQKNLNKYKVQENKKTNLKKIAQKWLTVFKKFAIALLIQKDNVKLLLAIILLFNLCLCHQMNFHYNKEPCFVLTREPFKLIKIKNIMSLVLWKFKINDLLISLINFKIKERIKKFKIWIN